MQCAHPLLKHKVIGFGLIVAGCNRINFSYFAEGPFYLIQLLGLSPSQYGLSFIAIVASGMCGGILSRKLHDHHESKRIMRYGLAAILIGSLVFSLLILGSTATGASKGWMILFTIGSQMMITLGLGMTTGNALALALVDYKWCIGTASSLFGFFYYAVISLFTLGMGISHNGTLMPMPLYFLGISLFMLVICKITSCSTFPMKFK